MTCANCGADERYHGRSKRGLCPGQYGKGGRRFRREPDTRPSMKCPTCGTVVPARYLLGFLT